MLAVVCKRMQQLPTMLGPAVHRGRVQPISLCKQYVMSVRGPNSAGRAVQTDPTLLRYALAIAEQKKCWELSAEKFDRFQTLRNNTQQHPTTRNKVCKRTQHVTSNNVSRGSCWPTMLRPFARGLITVAVCGLVISSLIGLFLATQHYMNISDVHSFVSFTVR